LSIQFDVRAAASILALLGVLAAGPARAEDMESFADTRTAWILLKKDRFAELDKHLEQVSARGPSKGVARDPFDPIFFMLKHEPVVAHLTSWCDARSDVRLREDVARDASDQLGVGGARRRPSRTR